MCKKYPSDIEAKKRLLLTLMPLVFWWPIPTATKLIHTRCQGKFFYIVLCSTSHDVINTEKFPLMTDGENKMIQQLRNLFAGTTGHILFHWFIPSVLITLQVPGEVLYSRSLQQRTNTRVVHKYCVLNSAHPHKVVF